ncbi:uncharacterized protein LOC144478847 [Augochlora pura]
MSKRTTRTEDSKDRKGCQLFRATDFASSMRLTMFCSYIIGFFPCNYKFEEYVFSKKKFAYSVIAACLHLAFQIYNFLLVNVMDTSSSFTQSMAENFFVFLDGSLPLLLFAAPFSMTVMFEQLSKLSRTLSRTDFNAIARVIHTIYIVNIVFYVISTLINYWMVVHLPVRRRFVNLYLGISSNMAVFCYMSCVRVLGTCFKKLNENLKQINGTSPDLRTELTEKQLSRRESTMFLTKVKYYEEVHEKISDAIEHLNRLFRTMNIVFTTSTFISVTFNLYNVISKLYAIDGVGTISEKLLLFEGFTFTVLRLAIFCSMVWFCETAANHATEITTTIHNCVSYCADDTVKREVID